MGHGDKELSDAPESDHEEERELEDEIRREREEAGSFARKNAAQVDQIKRGIESLSLPSFHSGALESTQNEVIHIATEGFSEQESDPKLEALLAKHERVMKGIKGEDPDKKNWNTKRFLAKSIGLATASSAILALIVELVSRNANRQPTDDIDNIPDDEKKRIESLVLAWQAQSDSDYWNALASSVEGGTPASPLSLADQILFMNYTIQYSPCTQPWIWDKTADKVKVVDTLIDAYHSGNNKTPAMYRSAAGSVTCYGVPLPRAIMADVLSLALSWLTSDE